MTYADLIQKVTEITGHKKTVVREVLASMPSILINLTEGDHVRTPLGTFRMFLRASKVVKPPRGKKIMTIPPGLAIKLKASQKMRKAIAAVPVAKVAEKPAKVAKAAKKA